MRWACGLVIATALAGCSEADACAGASSEVADCATAVRYADTVYVEGGATTMGIEPLGDADRASCEDAGPEARGACFTDEPPQVAVGRFAGHDPEQVVGAEVNGVTVVLFAEDVPEDVRREIARSGLVDPGTGPYTEDAFAD